MAGRRQKRGGLGPKIHCAWPSFGHVSAGGASGRSTIYLRSPFSTPSFDGLFR